MNGVFKVHTFLLSYGDPSGDFRHCDEVHSLKSKRKINARELETFR